ncbi:MAG: IS66 family transposase [Nanoarchaeota archaeon]|nr:IS66 family transposase [Nanoarchaeota archaeon]
MEAPNELKDLSREELIEIILELKKRLLAYENAHTPPSQDKRKYPKREKTGNKVGALKGHEGTTRPIPRPNRFEALELRECPHCNKQLGRPRSIQKKIIEDIPEPQPLIITEFTIPHYFCNNCKKEIVPEHPNLPDEGRFGPNLQAEITLMKYEDRLPHRKIVNTLNRRYELSIVPATVLDITERVSDKLQGVYERIKEEVRNSMQVNADETGQKVQGKNFWLWTFVTLTSVLFLIRKSRGQESILEALGKNYKGILTCDGWTSYPKCVKQLQRCWAHLLREVKWYKEKYGKQAGIVYNALCNIFSRIKKITVDTIQSVKTRTYNLCIKEMKKWIRVCKHYTGLKDLAVKLENGLEHWFTCILHPEIEPTNNKAERALRESVIQRKISLLWNEKGVRIKECVMSVLATWNLRNLNTFSMLRETLSS